MKTESATAEHVTSNTWSFRGEFDEGVRRAGEGERVVRLAEGEGGVGEGEVSRVNEPARRLVVELLEGISGVVVDGGGNQGRT